MPKAGTINEEIMHDDGSFVGQGREDERARISDFDTQTPGEYVMSFHIMPCDQ